MIRNYKVYRCLLCGNITSLLKDGGVDMVCCGKTMKLLVPGENDTAAKEKHVPVFTQNGNKVEVEVGSVLHPMTEEHLIEWISLVTETEVFTRFLNATDAPKATFLLPEGVKEFSIYEYCNLHGLFKV